jgi:hypothetical protein
VQRRGAGQRPFVALQLLEVGAAFRRKHEDILVGAAVTCRLPTNPCRCTARTASSPEDEAIFAYVRDEKFLVVLNFSTAQVVYGLRRSSRRLSSSSRRRRTRVAATLGDKLALPPWTGAVYEVSK